MVYTIFTEYLNLGAFWPVNKQVNEVLHTNKVILLVELMSFGQKFSNTKGWFYRTRKDLEQTTMLGATTQKRFEREFIRLGFIARETRGLVGTNWYRLVEENIREFFVDMPAYIAKFDGDLVAAIATVNPVQLKRTPAILAGGTAKMVVLNKNTVLDPIPLLRKETTTPQDTELAQTIPPSLRSGGNGGPPLRFVPQNNVNKLKQAYGDFVHCNEAYAFFGDISDDVAPAPVDIVEPVKSIRASIKEAKTTLLPKSVKKVVLSNRKLFKSTVEIVTYWNTKLGLRTHKLKETDGKYKWNEQTKAIQEVNDFIFKVTNGRLYERSEDIIHVAARTRKFSLESIKKAIDRIDLSTTAEYNGGHNKPALNTFFYNAHSTVYADKPESMYKYKYPFLHFVNGEVKKPVPFAKVSVNQGLVNQVRAYFESAGIPIADDMLNELTKAVDKAVEVLYDNKNQWKQTEIRMITEFPYVFYACYRDNSRSGSSDLSNLWYLASYKFEQHLINKRYI